MNNTETQLTLRQVVADAEENAKQMLKILRSHYEAVTDDGLDEESFILSVAAVLARARQLRADLSLSESWERASKLYLKVSAGK